MTQVKEFFEAVLAKRIAERPGLAGEVMAVFLFDILGDGGGQWTVNLKDQPGVKPGAHGDIDCTLECASADWQQIQDNPQVATAHYFDGKLKVSGDVLLATKLQQIWG